MMRTNVVRKGFQLIAVIGTIFALMLAGGAPSENTHGVARSFVSGAE